LKIQDHYALNHKSDQENEGGEDDEHVCSALIKCGTDELEHSLLPPLFDHCQRLKQKNGLH
jgi:hypothetical protein